MSANDAARELRGRLKAPTWAVTVSVWVEQGQESLLVRVDPKYRAELNAPESFRGYPVQVKWKTPIRAQN
jgi:hypothetical protein